jgi:hypothetical protein
MSRQTAYRLRARDAGFASLWDLAELRGRLPAMGARMAGRKSPHAQLARLERIALDDEKVAAVAADFDAFLSRLGEGQR